MLPRQTARFWWMVQLLVMLTITAPNALADLKLTVTATPPSVRFGNTLTLTFTVQNTGINALRNVSVVTVTPAYWLITDNDGGICNHTPCLSGDNINWTFGDLPSGQAKTIVIGPILQLPWWITDIPDFLDNTFRASADNASSALVNVRVTVGDPAPGALPITQSAIGVEVLPVPPSGGSGNGTQVTPDPPIVGPGSCAPGIIESAMFGLLGLSLMSWRMKIRLA